MLDWALRTVLLISLPAALGLILLSEPLLATIFYGGEFTAHDLTMATASLIAYAFGLLGFILVKVLATGYYSRQDTRTPVRIGVAALLLNMALNVVFVFGLIRVGYAAPHAGLAAATTIAALCNAALLLQGLRRTGVYRASLGWTSFAIRIALATGLMGIAVDWLRRQFGDWTALSVAERAGALTVCVLAGVLIYAWTCYLLGLRPASLHGKRPPATL
jgi:putative peptidoglycan lipid II flippase